MGSCFLCSFCKKRVFLKRRKYDGSYWTVLRPVFSLSTRYSASIRLGKAVRISPINLRASMCLRKRKARDCAGRLSESPNFSYSLMLKNSCGKLTHRAATIGAVGVSPAGKAGLLMCSSRERALLSLTAAPVSIHCGCGGKGNVFVYDGAANKIYEPSCCVAISLTRFMTISRFWWWMRSYAPYPCKR